MVIPITVSSDDPKWIYLLVTAICLYCLGAAMKSEIYAGRVKVSERMISIFMNLASLFISASKIAAALSVLSFLANQTK
jgi:hypothetical protein